MSIKINIHWHVWQELTNGQATIEVSGDTLGQCLRHLVKQFPGIEKEIFDKDGRLSDYPCIFVNGKFTEELAEPVKDGDEIDMIAPIGGG